MQHEEEQMDFQLEKLKQSILDVSQEKTSEKGNLRKEPYSFNKQLNQKIKKGILGSESNKQIDVLQAGDYLKLLCHQKKYLSPKRRQKISSLNESLLIQQESFKYLLMISTQANYFKLQYPGYYEKVLEQLPKYPKNMFSAIEKDIHRTFPNGHPFQESLRNILLTFAIKNPNLLYCQGMNYVVAYFLINSLSEQETFWIMNCLVENILPDDYFKDLSTISITTQIFSDVLPYLFPDMGRQMKNVGMDCSLFVVTWYVCLFTKGFINSVSAYLLTKLVLERRNHSFGFVLLKLSLGVIAAILGRDELFAFKPQFSAFRDKFELSVFEISLLQIKLGVEYVQLNEQNYLKLQKHYRDKRENRHSQALQRQIKKRCLTLPICNPDYPICLHRIQIQRKLGNISEVTISRNGYQISSQYIENYFDSDPKKQTTCTTYTTIEDCLMYRHNHVCQLDLSDGLDAGDLSRKIDAKIPLRHDDSFILERKIIQQHKNLQALLDCSSSVEIDIKHLRDNDDKFRQLSGYFVIDKDFKFSSQEEDNYDENQNKSQIKIPDIPNFGSSSSLDQPFSLAKELQKHHIEQEWIKNQEGLKNQEQIQITEEINKVSGVSVNQFGSNQKANSNSVENNKNQVGQKIFSQNSLNISQNSNPFFSKAKFWNFFDKTWKKVTKIKEEQLKN